MMKILQPVVVISQVVAVMPAPINQENVSVMETVALVLAILMRCGGISIS